jgi:hypothetical protein
MDPTDLQDNRILLLPDDFLPFGRLRGREVHQSMQQSSVATKVSQYEVFLNEVLKEDLRKANLQKARLRAELQEFEELEANLAQLRKVRPSKRHAVPSSSVYHACITFIIGLPGCRTTTSSSELRLRLAQKSAAKRMCLMHHESS